MTNENEIEIKKFALTIAMEMLKTYLPGKSPQTSPLDQRLPDLFDTAKKIEQYIKS